MIAVAADRGDQHLSVSEGDDIVVTLEENPTTGYQWIVESVNGEIEVVSTEFDPTSGGKPGAAGRRTIRLRAGGRGSGEVQLRCG